MPTESSTLSFHCALVTGGGGGIGKAIAKYFISQGKKVIIAGRTESTLRETAKEIGAADYYVLDTGVVGTFPDFVSRITSEHPELDCLVNNAGVQRPLDLVDEDKVEDVLGRADQEIDINVRGVMHLTLGLLGHFKKKEGGAVVMNVSSVLGFVPFAVVNPVYCGTKAWVHFWTMNLRTQLRKAGLGRIRVVEIAPPTVETDLHREREDPDDNKKEKNPSALSLEEFMQEVAGMLERGEEVIAPGMSGELVRGWYEQFGGVYDKITA
ncbi:putative short-chain dehydrogenases/reductase [Aspergillus ibericus CBS 121593]|uniref:Putative short-chain dehydrogenases/reductase n=1 Tax=Aspergillus ibericus CBS 121593 TaxID=1448316 RepID=A0A395H627_9EURO|nr:putative short-chain dehydrogenases/reductase [Aspergillus ibericus CBS 121593]RAL01724.1 putative short-chain dehydrogenases/reductase [Aspergillus ibericus CBS 121593]